MCSTCPQSFTDTFSASGVWSHTPGPQDQHDLSFPAGDFHPGVDPTTGLKVLTLETALLAEHGVFPAMPEPSTGLLVGSGLVLLAARRRRRAT